MQNKNLINEISKIILEKKWDISIAESSMNSLINSSFFMNDEVNESKIFKGGVIANSRISKENLCSVKTITLEKHGSISKEVAIEMAYGIKNKLKTKIALGITSNIESFEVEGKASGTVYFCIIIDEMIYDFEMLIPDNGKEKNNIILSQKILEVLYKSLLNIE